MMEFTAWEFWILITRWIMYLGMSAAVGGAASLHLMRIHEELKEPLVRYTLLFLLVGITAALAHFFVRVGASLEEGVTGMFEPDMVSMMWESAVGDALMARILGFSLFIVTILIHVFVRRYRPAEGAKLNVLEVLMACIAIGLIAFSFTEAGHAVEQPFLFQLVLSVHILLTAWWMGSLYPLWLICHRLQYNDAHQVLERFGQLAVFVVAVLFSGGLFLSYELTGWNNLFTDTYGNLLLTKLAFVGAILMLAAFHKLYLVPQLLHSRDAAGLKKSIFLEKIIGAGIFGITTVMTTLVGPVH
jgi:putative copper resistance protein D